MHETLSAMMAGRVDLLFAASMIWRFIFPYDSVFRMIALFMSRYIILTW